MVRPLRLAALLAGLAVAVCDAGQTPVPAAAPAARPQLFVQSAHLNTFSLFALSRDGRLLLTAGNDYGDGTVKLWQASTGMQLRNLVARSTSYKGTSVVGVAMSPDGRLVAAAYDDQVIRIWDALTGTETKRLFVPRYGASDLYFSPDGRYLVSLPEESGPGVSIDREPDDRLAQCPRLTGLPGFCESHEISVWDVRAGAFLYNATPPFNWRKDKADRWHVAVSPDGRLLITGVGAKPLEVRELATGRRVKGFADAAGPIFFSPDGKLIAASHADGALGIWTVASRALVKKLPRSAETPVAFRPNGRELILVNDAKDIGVATVSVRDIATGAETRRLELPAESGCFFCRVNVSPNGKWVARAGNGERRLSLWNLDDPQRAPRLWRDLSGPLVFDESLGRLVAYFHNRIWSVSLEPSSAQAAETCSPVRGLSSVGALVIGPSSQWIAVSSGSVVIWDAESDGPRRLTPEAASSVPALSVLGRGATASLTEHAISYFPRGDPPDEWIAPDCAPFPAAAAGRDTQGPWMTADPSALRASSSVPVALFPDGLRVAENFKDDTAPVYVTNVRGPGQVTFSAKVPRKENYAEMVSALAVSPDGSEIAAGTSMAPEITLWDANTLARRAVLAGHTNSVRALAYNPVTGQLASSGWDRTVKVWDRASHRVVRSWPIDGTPAAMAFRPDGQRLAIALGGDVLEFDDRGAVVRRYSGHGAPVNAAAYTANGKVLVSAGEDGTTRLWNAENGSAIGTLVAIPDSDDWLVTAANGYFDGSPTAWRQILWRFSNAPEDVTPMETYYREFHRQGLLKTLLAGELPSPPKPIETLDRRLPSVEVAVPGIAHHRDTVAARRTRVSVTVHEAPRDAIHPTKGSGVRDVRLFRNGTLVHVWRGEIALTGGSATLTAGDIAVVDGDNRFMAYAFNHDDIKSTDGEFVVTGAPPGSPQTRRGTQWVIAIGVNQYPRSSLSKAVGDANAMADRLGANSNLGPSPQTVRLPDGLATKANILLALDVLAGRRELPSDAPKEMLGLKRAEPEDTLFVFFAGHGIADKPRFYLLPSGVPDVGTRDSFANPEDYTRMTQASISDLDLAGAFEGIDAGRILFMIDACQSAQVIHGDDDRQGPMNSQGIAQLAYEKGMYIITAAQDYQKAAEFAKQDGHGVLTAALLEQLDAIRTPIPIRQYLNRVVDRVPQLFRQARAEINRPVRPDEDVQRAAAFIRRTPDQWALQIR